MVPGAPSDGCSAVTIVVEPGSECDRPLASLPTRGSPCPVPAGCTGVMNALVLPLFEGALSTCLRSGSWPLDRYDDARPPVLQSSSSARTLLLRELLRFPAV